MEIVCLPDPMLRRKAHKVTGFDKDLQTLIDNMIATMREAPGVGLAAPQVGKSIRLVVIEFGSEDDEDIPKKLFVVINPEIVKVSEEMVDGIEGCLSVPDLVGLVKRHKEISVKGLNRFGKPFKINASGWLARIFQHEIDHLNGVVFTDIADRVWQPAENEEPPTDV